MQGYEATGARACAPLQLHALIGCGWSLEPFPKASGRGSDTRLQRRGIRLRIMPTVIGQGNLSK